MSLTLLTPVSSCQPPAPLLLCHTYTHVCLNSDLDMHTRENMMFCEPPQSAPSIVFLLFIEQSHSRIAESVSVEYLKGRVTTVTMWLVKAPNSSQSWDDERINEPGAH